MDYQNKSKDEIIEELREVYQTLDSLTDSLKNCKDALRESKVKYKNLIENISDVIYEIDQQGTILNISPSVEKLLGYKVEEVIGKNFLHFVGENRDFLAARFLELREKTDIQNEYKIHSKNGDTHWIRLSTKAIFEGDHFKGGSGTLIDITEKKLIEIELQNSESLYRSILNASPDTIIITDLDQKILFTSPMAFKMFGYVDPNAFINRQLLDFINSKDHSKAREAIKHMFKGTFTGATEFKGIKADGSTFDLDVNGEFIRDADGKLSNMIFISRDISDRKSTEEGFRILSLAVEQSPVSIVITDLDANIEYVNPSFQTTTGYSSDEIIGVNSKILKSGETDKAVYDDLWATIRSGKGWSSEWKNKKKNGEIFWEHISITPIHNEAGEITNYLAVKQDITQRKQAEKEIHDLNANLELRIKERTSELAEINRILLKEIEDRITIEDDLRNARIEAEQANVAKSEFLSRMSHELRTPMNSILGFAQLLQMAELNSGEKKWIGYIMHSGRHLLDLINEVLDISSIEAGRLSLSLEPVQLNSIIQEMMDIVRPHANKRQLSLELVNSANDQLFVKSDRQRLKQILLNLLYNAIKYNKEEGVILIKNERITAKQNGKTYVRISITDTGLGIDPKDIPKLFTPFERIGANKTTTEGTGLGLTVVKKLIDAMGGYLGVDSVLGKGSTFWIELPHCESQLADIEKSGLLTELESGLNHRKGTILYIEDNPLNIELVEQILAIQRLGIKLISNDNGLLAFNLAIEHQPDLILLDLNLPDLHGSKVLKMLQTDTRTKAIPVVIISADAMLQQINELLNAGASRFLTKPIDVNAFLKVVDEFITN